VDEQVGLSRGEVPLRLRIGISGHRNVTSCYPGLDDVLRYVLDVIMGPRAAIAADSTPVCVRVVSSLAEGADRVLVQAMVPASGQLEAILPLDRADYCADFDSATSKQEFASLLAEAAVTEVMPPAASRDDAYESAGKSVVDRSDVMVFMWDGHPARGRGGTAEIYEYALQRKKAIFWICTDGGHAELVLEPWGRLTPLSPAALRQLDRYNGKPLPATRFAECPPRLGQLGGTSLSAAKGLCEHISFYFARADALAGRFQRRWFWLTRLIYAFAALAVLIVAAQVLYEPRHERYAWFEFGTLVCVTILLFLARFSHWHDRWISARYLAEQIRSLAFLGLAGVSVTDDTGPASRRPRPVEAASWTDRAVEEIWWSRPSYIPGDVDATLKILDELWINDQLKYHDKTSRNYEKRSRRFTWAAVSLFTLSAVAALLHSIGIEQPHSLWGFLSIVVPAVGASLSGYGAQRDYARHAERSRLFAITLDQARYQLAAAASLHDIQQVALNVTMLMRSEAGDWYSNVRVQEIEPP
jgi:SMODS and SLOG-associating 2TM effector domain 1